MKRNSLSNIATDVIVGYCCSEVSSSTGKIGQISIPLLCVKSDNIFIIENRILNDVFFTSNDHCD